MNHSCIVGEASARKPAAFLPSTPSVRQVRMTALKERVTFGGVAVTAAFRLWFDQPDLDRGYVFERASDEAPVLTITYRLSED